MKKYLLGIGAIALALSASAFKSFSPFLYVDAASVTATNVLNAETYGSTIRECNLISEVPCKLDLGQIESQYNVIDEASFLAYLSNTSLFPTASDKIAEVQRITVEWKQ